MPEINPNPNNENKETTVEILTTQEDALENEAGETSALKPRSFLKELYEYVETFCYALVLMILLFMFIFRYVSVDGESMRDTLQDNDKLVISNLAYTPQTGDIVVLKHSPKPLIKRVIATGGQTVKINDENWEIFVDDVLLDEPYVLRTSEIMDSVGGKLYEEFVVKEGEVYVMGDNRNNSLDSRAFGSFSAEDILGRVIFRVFPLSQFGNVDNQ